MPDVKVVKIGGQSVLDRGRAALFPILDEIVAARKLGIQVVLLAGGGTRARHIYSIASELEMPTGVLATLGKYIPMQNARMLQMLLAKHGGIYILPDDFEKLPLYFQIGCIPIMSGMPPFGYWEKREEGSRIPPHRTDAGVFLSAEFLGVAARDLHQGRGRPLHRRSEEEPDRDAHPADHGEGAHRRATCPTSSSSASSSSTCPARAGARSCRSSTASSRARCSPRSKEKMSERSSRA